jgi:hypothetical protein
VKSLSLKNDSYKFKEMGINFRINPMIEEYTNINNNNENENETTQK